MWRQHNAPAGPEVELAVSDEELFADVIVEGHFQGQGSSDWNADQIARRLRVEDGG